MESEPNSPLHERTKGALAGIAHLDFATLAPGAHIIALTVIGDALRLGSPLPPIIVQKLQRSLSEEHVLGALDQFAVSVGRWSLPARAPTEEPDPGLESALRRRDEAESLLIASRFALLPRGILVDTSEQVSKLSAAMKAHDLSCGSTLTRSEAEAYLGDRFELVGLRSWLDAVPWAAEESLTDDASHVALELSGQAQLSLETLEAYVVEGLLRKTVEAIVARSPELAAELEDMIGTYREHGGPVSLVARRWLANRASSNLPAGAVVVLDGPGPAIQMAAADEASVPEAPFVEHELGVLDPLDARASLRATDTELSLTVYAGATLLRSVELDGIQAEPPKRGGTWALEVDRHQPAADATHVLRVSDINGRSFEARLAIAPGAK